MFVDDYDNDYDYNYDYDDDDDDDASLVLILVVANAIPISDSLSMVLMACGMKTFFRCLIPLLSNIIYLPNISVRFYL